MSDFKWRAGCPWSRLDAGKVARELKIVRQEYGSKDKSLTANDVVEYAQSHKRSELFKAFDWDKNEAANRWWLHQAQDLISAIREVKVTGGQTVVTRSNYSVGGGVFVTNEQIQQSADYQTIVMRRALSALEGWQDRYSEIVGLCGASDPINDAINMLRGSLSREDAAE